MDWEASEGSVSPGSAMGAGTHSGCSEYRFHLALCQNTCSNRSESHSEFSSSFHLAGVLAIHAGKWNLTSAARGTENYNSKKNQRQHHDPETTSHLCLINRTHRRYWDIFIWGFNENWWTGSLSKKIHISREESSIHVTVTKSWQKVFPNMKNGLCQSGMKMQIPQPGNNEMVMKQSFLFPDQLKGDVLLNSV